MKNSVKQLILCLICIFSVVALLPDSISLVYAAEPGIWTLVSSMTKARQGHTATEVDGKIYVMGGADENSNYLSSLEIYDIATGVWTSGKNMPVARIDHTATYVNGKIYLIGGKSSDSAFAKPVSIYDIATDTWTSGPNMQYTRRYHTATYYDGNIYIIGGYDGSAVSNVLYFYDVSNDVWKSGATMNYYHYHHTSTLYNGKIYVIGGKGGTTNTRFQNMVEIYDINLDYWSIGNNMKIGRNSHGAVEVDGLIYVIAGAYSPLSNDPDTLTVEVYNTANGSWSFKANVLRERKAPFGCFYADGKIYIMGGWAGSIVSASKTMDVYDIRTDTWIKGPDMNYRRMYGKFIYYDNSIYAIGGSFSPGSNYGIIPTVEVYGTDQTESIDPLQVVFDSNGGNTPSFTEKKVTLDAPYGELPTVERYGHAFEGWYTEPSGGVLINSKTIVTNDSNHTLYAQWTATPLTKIENLTCIERTSTSIKLEWTAVKNADSYEIFFDDQILTSETNSITLNNLTPNTTYTFQVRAVNSIEKGPLSVPL